MKPWIFPAILIVLDLCAAVFLGCQGEWLAGAVLVAAAAVLTVEMMTF